MALKSTFIFSLLQLLKLLGRFLPGIVVEIGVVSQNVFKDHTQKCSTTSASFKPPSH